MKDIVRILQDVATTHALIYHYGKKAALNLLDGTAEPDVIYLLHEFTNRKSKYNSSGTQITGTGYEGKFFLVKHSDFSQQYFNEAGVISDSKYIQNIEPLLQQFTALGNSLACLGLDVQQWDNIDVTDALDANMDGLLCSYKINIPGSYE